MTSLTERYLAATLRGLPESKRADVERELRSSIADAITDRVEAGEDRAAAESAVLEGLGNPARLAADYAGRPQYLIGPEVFEAYRQLLIRVAAVVIPLAALVLTTIAVADGRGYIPAISDGLIGALMIGIQLVFWVTLLFVFIERADSARDARAEIAARGRWTVAQLPGDAPDRVTVGETIGELFTLLITIGSLLFLRDQAWFTESGAPATLLDPGLQGFWLPLLLGLLLGLATLHVVVHVAGRWTLPFAAAYAALNTTFAVAVVGLALNGALVNRAFAAQIGWPTLPDGNGVAMIAVAVVTTLVAGLEILGVVQRARRPRRSQVVGNVGATSAI